MVSGMAALTLLASCVPYPHPRSAAALTAPASVTRGEYLFAAANCAGCHTADKAAPLAGGRALKTAFGTFYTRNITPDPVHGIGAWSDADFIHALRDGVSPDGDYYFPAFPFPSFTGMSDRDLLDIRAYLLTRPAMPRQNRADDSAVPRPAMAIWRTLEFTPGPSRPDPARSATWNRGAYLANAVAHCGECHTPRDLLGGLENERRFAGAPVEGSDKVAPNLTEDRDHGIGKWSLDDVATVLANGMKPNGDFVGQPMSEVIDGTAKLTEADRRAIATYIKSVTPAR